MTDTARTFFELSERIHCLPVVHGSADFALAVRDELLASRYDCVAVPLPPSFQEEVELAVDLLPEVRAIVQSCGDDADRFSYVPIDPCQPVIRALRVARQERIARAFIDLELRDFRDDAGMYPDPYALKSISPMQFAAALLAAAPTPPPESPRDRRIRHMAFELHKLELEHERILFIPSVIDWPWIRVAYKRRLPYPEEEPFFAPVESHLVDRETLYFFLSELPYVTHLYQRVLRGFEAEKSLSIDGIKELVIETRDRALEARPSLRKRISIQLLRVFLKYARNLTLVRRRLTPDLVTLVEAAKQVCGDDYAIELVQTAKEYPEQPDALESSLRMGQGQADIPLHGIAGMESRLPGQAYEWRNLDLRRRPDAEEQTKWTHVWNPYTQCSWPPEDSRIESFNLHVREQAKNMISSDLARVEKFTTSLKDGLDIRETLRNWHNGDLYVRELPPARGGIEIVVFLFDVPADPQRYAWRTTWFAEHDEESTLAFYATDFMNEMVGPGIGQARYGGAFFLFPPRAIFDIWRDPALEFATTLEERLLAAAFKHSRERYVAVVSPCPMKATWRRLARRFGKQAVHLPLSRFSASTVDRLRTFHVLNGRQIRSYAANFIRRME